MLKTFKRLSAAQKVAGGRPIIAIRSGANVVYLVSDDGLPCIKQTEVELIAPSGAITGHITMGHLDRLGNGNWAREKWSANLPEKRPTAFPQEA